MSMRLLTQTLCALALVFVGNVLVAAKPPDLPAPDKVDCKESVPANLPYDGGRVPAGAIELEGASEEESDAVVDKIDALSPSLYDLVRACGASVIESISCKLYGDEDEPVGKCAGAACGAAVVSGSKIATACKCGEACKCDPGSCKCGTDACKCPSASGKANAACKCADACKCGDSCKCSSDACKCDACGGKAATGVKFIEFVGVPCEGSKGCVLTIEPEEGSGVQYRIVIQVEKITEKVSCREKTCPACQSTRACAVWMNKVAHRCMADLSQRWEEVKSCVRETCANRAFATPAEEVEPPVSEADNEDLPTPPQANPSEEQESTPETKNDGGCVDNDLKDLIKKFHAAMSKGDRCLAHDIAEKINAIRQARTMFVKAEQLRRVGQAKQACKAYERVSRICPDCPHAQAAEKRLRQMEAKRTKESTREVSEESEKKCEKHHVATDSSIEDQVAELLEESQRAFTEGDCQAAEKLARRAQEIDPECVAANVLVYRMHLLKQIEEKRKSANSIGVRAVSSVKAPIIESDFVKVLHRVVEEAQEAARQAVFNPGKPPKRD